MNEQCPDQPNGANSAIPLADLVDRAQAGDSEAIEQVYFQILPVASNIVRKMVPNRSAAEELADAAIVRILDRGIYGGAYHPTGDSFDAWATTVSTNMTLDYVGAKAQTATTLLALIPERPASEEVEETVLRHLYEAVVETMLEKAHLPDLTETCIRLHFMQGYSYEDIMREVPGIPNANALKQRIYRGMQLIRRTYGITPGVTKRQHFLDTIHVGLTHEVEMHS